MSRATRSLRRFLTRPKVIVTLVFIGGALLMYPATHGEQQPGVTQTAQLVRVIDGDTIRVQVEGEDHRVRILGIDAPELARDGTPAELLIRSGPPLLTGPWVEYDEQRRRYWFNPDAIAEHAGYLSGGERRVLNIAAAIATDDHPTNLGSEVAGIDRHHLDLVLAAIAHAAGSHEHSSLDAEVAALAGTARLTRLPSLHPWPEGERQ